MRSTVATGFEFLFVSGQWLLFLPVDCRGGSVLPSKQPRGWNVRRLESCLQFLELCPTGLLPTSRWQERWLRFLEDNWMHVCNYCGWRWVCGCERCRWRGSPCPLCRYGVGCWIILRPLHLWCAWLLSGVRANCSDLWKNNLACYIIFSKVNIYAYIHICIYTYIYAGICKGIHLKSMIWINTYVKRNKAFNWILYFFLLIGNFFQQLLIRLT